MASEITPAVHITPPDRPAHFAALRDITSHGPVMSWVANGRTWDAKKLDRFFRYCADEALQTPQERKNYYYAIVVDGACAGVVGIHPIHYDSQARGHPALTIFVAPAAAGKGVGTRAVQAALDVFRTIHPNRAVLLDIRVDNAPMIRVAEKLGLTPDKRRFKIGAQLYSRFIAAADRR